MSLSFLNISKSILRLLAAGFMVIFAPDVAWSAETLRLGVLPWREPEILHQMMRPTLQLLERQLGQPVELVISHDYAELGKRLSSKAVDLAMFGGASYIEAKDKDASIRYLVTLKNPDDHYFSYILVRKDSPLQTLADVRGKSLGLTDKQSTSGYLFPTYMLLKANIDPAKDTRLFLLKKHPKVYEAVARGTVDAGGVDSGAYQDAVKANGDVFRVLAKSDPIPRDPVVAGGHVPADLAERVRDILAHAEQDPPFKSAGGEIVGYSALNDAFYDSVRATRDLNLGAR
ncbi:phosphonate transport system substrate-binding protein [Gammaproteobacteria bacterium]